MSLFLPLKKIKYPEKNRLKNSLKDEKKKDFQQFVHYRLSQLKLYFEREKYNYIAYNKDVKKQIIFYRDTNKLIAKK